MEDKGTILYKAVGTYGKCSRNVTATDPQLVTFHSQHVPNDRVGILEKNGVVVWDMGGV